MKPNIKKAISLSVYKNPLYKGCSAGGISEKYDEILILHDEGYIPVDLNDLPENLCKVVVRNIGRTQYLHLEPWTSVSEGMTGWMAGGAYAASSDSRFAEISDYPLSIHDRAEKPW